MSDTTPTTELPPRYDATAVQSEVAKVWDDERLFHAEPDASKEPFSVVIPPPNVTAALHLGHALNNTIQDILVRHARMRGLNAVWIPGTDHAGIATQTVVDKRLQAAGEKALKDYKLDEAAGQPGREQFIGKVQAWKDEYETVILGQLKAMGCSCDFERTAFTMDPPRAAAVREAFFRLFKDGLIYRGKRLVNWDPVTQTALADDEVENEEIDGKFYYLRYPLAPLNETRPESTSRAPTVREGSSSSDPDPSLTVGARDGELEYVVVATTRPETMLGDTAVAINPNDPRAAGLRGKKVLLPIVDREIPIVEDDYVVMPSDESDPKAKFATGFLKVTPAHDPNDWDIGQRHSLAAINIMAPDASISDAHGWTPETDAARQFVGLSREAAREAIVSWFKEHDLLEEVRPYRHSVGHSYRSHVPVEPYLSDQWYVAVQKPIPWMPDTGKVEGTDVPANSLAGLALTALTGCEKIPASPDREGGDSASRSEPLAHAQGSRETLSYLITFTTYGTWLQGRELGSADPKRHNIPGEPYLVGDEDEERRQFARLKHEPTELDEAQRITVQDAIVDVCRHRGWTLHALHVRSNHLHAVVSADATPEKVMTDFKAYATRRLREESLVDGERKVWTRHGSTRYLKTSGSVEGAIRYTVDRQGRPLNPASVESVESDASPDREGGVSGARSESEPLPDGRGSQGSFALGDDVLRFVPDRYAKTYTQWNAALRDWCISRQLWWGHRIPVWSGSQSALYQSDLDPGESTEPNELTFGDPDDPHGIAPYYSYRRADSSWGYQYAVPSNADKFLGELDKAGFEQDPDVLDTWFSSALWPMSTLGWPDRTPALEQWNPTSVLCTAREIITLWVSRMVMFNRYLLAHPDEQRSDSKKDVEQSHASPDRQGGVLDDRQTSELDPATLSELHSEPLPHGRGPRGADASHLPFKDVFIHAMIQDGHGQKMSKSLGNGVDPLAVIDSHGADAMRFTLCGMTTHTQDVRLPVDLVDPHTGETFPGQTFTNNSGYTVFKPIQEHKGKHSVSPYGIASGEATATDDRPAAGTTSSKFDHGRNFANKIWNAGRFVISNLHNADVTGEIDLTTADRWILSRLAAAVRECDAALADYRFDRYATAIYDFFWRDFCDWYVESTKPRMKAQDAAAAATLAACLDGALRLMHPIMPFVSERLWWALNEAMPTRGIEGVIDLPANERCITAAWPTVTFADEAAEASIERVREIAEAVRRVRTENKVPPRQTVPVAVEVADDVRQTLELWANCEVKETVEDAAETTAADTTIRVGGVVDKAADADRVAKEKAALQKQVAALSGRLSNKGYTDRAPPHLVQETRDQLAKAEADLAKL